MGQTVSALGNPVTFQKDPQNFSGSEWAARFLGNGVKGLGQGMQNYQQQNQALRRGGAPMDFASVPSTPTPMYSTENLPGGPTRNPLAKGVDFYGG